MAALDAVGRSVLPRVRKSRAVLAMLALAAPQPVARDAIAALLWSQRDRDQARASLRQCVHELQELLTPLGDGLLRADRNYLALLDDGLVVDARVAATGIETMFQDLVGLDPAFDRWMVSERRRAARRAAVSAEAALSQETRPDLSPDTAIAAAEQLLAIDQTHEGAWRTLMSAFAARGERARAVDAYHRCAAAIADIMETSPSDETQALLATLRQSPEQAAAAAVVDVVAFASIEPRPRGARLGVMPFRALSGATDDPLSLGLADEITTALSRFRWIFVIASPSLAGFARGGDWEDAKLKALPLDFVLDGTVQRAMDRVRVNVRLLDLAAGGEVAWSGQFDRRSADILTLQDEIAAETVARLDPELLLREGRRAAARKSSNVSAYDLVLSAIPTIYRLEEASYRTAGRTLAAAVALDPDYAAGYAWWACWYLFLIGQDWATDRDDALVRAGELADRAITLDPADARGMTIAGHVRAYLHHRVPEALDMHDRALSLNPNLPLAWSLSGLALIYAGRHDEALQRIRHAQRLSPFDPHGYFFDMVEMLAHLMRGEYQTVLELGRRSMAHNPAFSSTYKTALCAMGHLGLVTEAVTLRARLFELEPKFRIIKSANQTPLMRPEDRANYIEGLRRAGLPM